MVWHFPSNIQMNGERVSCDGGVGGSGGVGGVVNSGVGPGVSNWYKQDCLPLHNNTHNATITTS